MKLKRARHRVVTESTNIFHVIHQSIFVFLTLLINSVVLYFVALAIFKIIKSKYTHSLYFIVYASYVTITFKIANQNNDRKSKYNRILMVFTELLKFKTFFGIICNQLVLVMISWGRVEAVNTLLNKTNIK